MQAYPLWLDGRKSKTMNGGRLNSIEYLETTIPSPQSAPKAIQCTGPLDP